MTTQSLPHDPTAILAGVEAFIDALPATRRRKRTQAEIYEPDQRPETENYEPEPEPTVTIELNEAALVRLPVLLAELAQTRSTAMAQLVTLKIYRLLGLELEDDK